MTKTVTHIDCPKEWESTNDWDSHRPLLYVALNNTEKGIIEFGCGDGSTDLLRNHKHAGFKFLSFENNKEWASKFGSKTGFKKYLELPNVDTGMIFIDSAPGEERKYLIAKHNMTADVIVVHDTEEGAEYVYGMKEILSTFKYRLDYQPLGKPHTTAVSNFIDLTNWL